MSLNAVNKSILLLLFAVYSTEATAAITNAGLLDNVLATYKAAATGWAATITARATFLFWSLATISMVWTFGMLHLRRADIGEFYGEFIKFSVFTGFFNWLLLNGPTMATAIIDSMKSIGATASGNASALSPSGIVDIGFSIFFSMIDNSSIMQPVDSVVGIIIAGIILVVLALIGVNMLLLLISAWILSYAGIFYLGFGGAHWTSDMAISYFKTVLNVGVQLLTMVLLVGIGNTFITDFYANMTQGTGMGVKEMGTMLVASVVLLVLTNKVPALVGQIAMGGGTGALGQGYGAGSAMAAAGVTAATAAVGGAAIASASANMAGGVQALQAAYQKAAEYDAANGSGMSMSSGTADYNRTSQPSGSGSSGSSSFSNFMGFGGGSGKLSEPAMSIPQQNTSAGALLAKATAQVAGEKYQNIKDSIQARIDQTIPGQIATAIRNDDGPSFSENSLSGGTEEFNAEEETAEFVNRSKEQS